MSLEEFPGLRKTVKKTSIIQNARASKKAGAAKKIGAAGNQNPAQPYFLGERRRQIAPLCGGAP